ncbi:hypothetical protein GTY89_42890, partial [Streptomyces sp. SID5471]|nr:hypothetical protein [Streptomyces sp. SID5471]
GSATRRPVAPSARSRPQRECQPDRAGLPGQAAHAVHRVVVRDVLHGFIR